jgi:hypothetical protein
MTSPSPFADSPLVQDAYLWAQSADPVEPPKEHYCGTRDVLSARLDRCRSDALRAGMPEEHSYLFRAILGEIGNNAYDHNLGAWPDLPGIQFLWNTRNGLFLSSITDRGQGILTTLKQALPTLQTDEEALQAAFLKRISGRAPEKRGNGLKYVRSLLLADGIDLLFQSGTAQYHVTDKYEQWQSTKEAVPGCLVVVACRIS